MMKKMLVVDNTNINNLILHEVFDSQYEVIDTDSSEKAFQLIKKYMDEIAVIIIDESIAANFTDDMLKSLDDLKVFKYIPIIMVIDISFLKGKTKVKDFAYTDILYTPINPYVIKKRVANLTDLFIHRKELEATVQNQNEKIISQDNMLKSQERKMNTDDMMELLSDVVNYRDIESGNHLMRMRKYTEILLRILAEKNPKYDLTEDKIKLISSASALHDVGKIAIPDAILLNPRRLTSEEFNIMKQHTAQGCNILEELDSVKHDEYYIYCYQICRYHHEKYDGKGYPDGLVGDEIPICAQVVSVADCYDALTNERPYKPAFTHEQASEMIKTGACGAFSKEMMECFEKALPQFKELAEKYQNESTVPDTSDKYVKTNENTRLKKIYNKADKKDLIAVIERQKKNIVEERKYCSKILYSIADFVLEFDFRQDSMVECKGSITNVLGYMPKNYYEAVIVLSNLCSDDCKKEFKNKFSLDNVQKEGKKGKKRIALECMMKTGKKYYSRVQFYAVPNLENGELVSVYCVALILKSKDKSKLTDETIKNAETLNESCELKKYSAIVKKDEKVNLIDFEKRLVPVVNSKTGKIISYNFIEVQKENNAVFRFDEMYESLYYTTNVTAFSLNSMKRIISSIYALEQEGINYPSISIMTMFSGLDTEKVIKAIGEIFLEYPINCHKICINITQDMLKTLNLKGLEKFIDAMRNYGFKVCVYNVGMNSINTKCFTQRLFDRVIFANQFLDDIENGTYPLELITYMIEYFARLGTEVYMPMDVKPALVEKIKANTSVPFGIPQNKLTDFDTFKKNMRIASITPVYPILSHENIHPVLSEKMYDEILVQTKSFILEWTPDTDTAVFSGSFEKLYGYVPQQSDFLKNIKDTDFVHNDDINKFIEKIVLSRSEDSDAEFLIRIFNKNTDEYLWNKMRIVSERNLSGEAVKTAVICTDVSDRQADADFGILRNKRTAFIANLYRRHAAENIIKTFLDGEGAEGTHALIIAEVSGYELLEETLGSTFANAVIKEISVKIRELFSDFDIIGSHSENQFTVFVKNLSDVQKLTEKAEQIRSVINNKYSADSDEINIFGKTGISIYKKDGVSYEELYNHSLKELNIKA